jgi:hypothetical protein
MGGLFGSKPKPKPVKEIPAVEIDDEAMAKDEESQKLRRRGRSSTILAGSALGGTQASTPTRGKTLLGE